MANGNENKKNAKSFKWVSKLGFGNVEEIDTIPNPRDDDVLIIVMGPTGVGKSTFIQKVTMSQDVVVGHKLKSCTRDLSWHQLPESQTKGFENRRVFLIDTPGFDDTFDDDSQILKRITAWLAKSYSSQMPIAGIVYMNDITQKRMFGSTRMNLTMFQKLCGEESFQKVVMATSQWDTLSNESIGTAREEQLKTNFWKDVLDGNATYMAMKEEDSLTAIINHILATYRMIEQGHLMVAETLKIQDEIVVLEKSLPATSAGQELRYTLQELMELQKAALKNVHDEERKKAIEEKMKQLGDQVSGLKMSFSERFRRFFRFGK
ncbi:P-loop containing nucleoside triphosphate hydrolase protein [Coprinopsis marcescibilis]|uniref:P-loop containing nucleoside triphosphate hydrolase protein n=1 Tax=Coprinopsis marcescibilis TaxID=230819 RepID=A0A5C3L6T6_COPMA|nr:P-loop containing nucleoside triphosphate hydrolase protein [Coprinopsis marcescibilis]